VRSAFTRAERVGERTTDQVRKLRGQLHAFRERQPEMQRLTGQFQKELQHAGAYLGNQQVDFQAIAAVRDALGDVAEGLDGFTQTLDPKAVGRLGTALDATAHYLEDKVAPTAVRAAEQLETSAEALRVEADNLGAAIRTLSLEPAAVREGISRLDRLDQALVWMSENLEPDHLQMWKERLADLERSLREGADRVAFLGAQTYPLVTMVDLVPKFEERPIWPEGRTTAEGLRQAANLLGLVNRLTASAAGPAVPDTEAYRKLLKESRQVIFHWQSVLRMAANQREELVPVLKNLPENAARLAEDLPRLASGLARLLRDTDRLKEVAGVLRQARQGLDHVVEDWPELQKKIGRSAVLLRVTRNQLTHVLEHRDEYESAVKGVSGLAQALGANLPVFTRQLERDLAEQERALQRLDGSITEVTAGLPEAEARTTRLLGYARLLLWLLAAAVAVHGGTHLARALERGTPGFPLASSPAGG
jgi:ABC-type transporter Mla subunit MlaD